MPAVLTLQVRPEPTGGWALQLTRLGQAPVAGALRAEEVEALIARQTALLRPPPVIVPGQVARREENEELAGQTLAQLFAAPGFTELLNQAIGAKP